MRFSKVFLMLILSMTFVLSLYADIEYRVSGKVLFGKKGIEDIDVNVYLTKGKLRKKVTTNIRGEFHFNLKPGSYNIDVDPALIQPTLDIRNFDILGPDHFIVKDRNFDNLLFQVIKYSDVIEDNLLILKKIPTSTPTVDYLYGRIPIHSLESCRKAAEEELENIRTSKESELAIGAKIGTPVIFYDFQNNPILYQFRILREGITIGYITIFTVGLVPELHEYAISDLKLADWKKRKSEISKTKTTYDEFTHDAKEVIAENKQCSLDDILLLKFLGLVARRGGCHYALLRIKSGNEEVLINLSSFDITSDWITKESIEKESEEAWTYLYIKDYKKKQKPAAQRKIEEVICAFE